MPRFWDCLERHRRRIRTGALACILPAGGAALGCGAETTTPLPPVTVTGVVPAEGPLTGGTSLTITGTNFADVTDVTIGGARLAGFVVRSSTEITAYTPPVTDAAVADIVVSSRTHPAGSCAACFTYYDPRVTIAAVSPDTGPLPGGTPVTISGTGFIDVTSVTIGGVALGNPTMVSFTEITGTTAARVVQGAVDVVVRGSGGSATCAGCFTYQLEVDAQPLAAGGWHSCALAGSGAAYCWGLGGSGRLGDGLSTSSSAPVAVSGGLTFRAITTGDHHTCALTPSGVAYCWGWNAGGQLGDSSLTDRTTPVAVYGDLTFSTIAADGDLTCGVARSGTPYCWGWGGYAQLGDGSYTTRQTPVRLAGSLTFSTITTGHHHGCGLTPPGVAYCWGADYAGQLGDGSTVTRPTPVAVSGGLTFKLITAGGDHTCALAGAAMAYCWGGSYGQGTVPVALSGNLEFSALDAGYSHTCGITGTGAALCWGSNRYGQLGDGSTTDRYTPGPVTGGLEFSYVSGGQYHTCGMTTAGAVYCWGSNGDGQLGNGTLDSSTVPVAVLPFGGLP